MTVNPEIRRYRWTELTRGRLILALGVLSLMCLFWYAVEGPDWRGMGNAAVFVFIAFNGFWGGRLAHASVVDEVGDNTWDWQRLSSVHPWTLTLGKLIGATLYPWYIGALALLVFFITGLTAFELPTLLRYCCVLVLAALTLHGLGLFGGLLLVQRRGDLSVSRAGSVLVLVFLAIWIFPLANLFESGHLDSVEWYAETYGAIDFLLFSLVVAVAWIVAGGYFLMRAELAYRNACWPILGFALTIGWYVSGFADTDGASLDLARALVYFAAAMMLTIVSAFVEPKGFIVWRAFVRDCERRDFRRMSQSVPRWTACAMLSVALLAVAVALSGSEDIEGKSYGLSDLSVQPTFLISLTLFILRDLALLTVVSFMHEVRRVEMVTFIVLMVFYVFLPGIVTVIGPDWLLAFFLPTLGQDIYLAIGAPAIELAFVIWLGRKRFRQLTVYARGNAV